ncbi:hypothetical protein KIH39_15970 [Telmatocola sphagniphila]|uniref:Uncharacterized protein n=1 Tax=Telmatocola sphagniphila TaxID=1123043 RepID=A0A8E6B2Y7_9BACT|nr:hypothetical protein [Telmatocola sphagniphila]QVL30347.1 hypothetical protein KIH39_15970 [Telmatocola sphagniphila]
MCKIFVVFILLLIGLYLHNSNSHFEADITKKNLINEVFQDADLVAICKPLKKSDGGELVNLKKKYGFDTILKLYITDLEVKQVFKGPNLKEIKLHHYEIHQENEVVIQGNLPNILTFKYDPIYISDSKSIYLRTEAPLYLLYLKKSDKKDNLYTTVTDIVDSRSSCFELYRPIELIKK